MSKKTARITCLVIAGIMILTFVAGAIAIIM